MWRALVVLSFITLTTYSQPNIVLILVDDVGWNDVGFHGSNQIPTPNIDALAYNGMILNRFYTLPTCTPSRATLLTGQYAYRLGLQGIPIVAGENRHLPIDIPTLPQKLKELDYATYLVGKWHLGSAYKNVTPTMRGFDHHFGYWHGYVGYFNHYAKGGEMTGLDLHDGFSPEWGAQGEYLTHLLTQKAEDVILRHKGDKPFFLMLSHLAGHTGKNGDDLEVPNLNGTHRKFDYILDEKRRLYAGIMSELDDSVGKIVEALAKKNVLDNTIIFFMSDNGAQTEGVHENRGSNWPLRGMKFSLHDGGVRNLAVFYSSKLQQKGSINQELLHISDLLPTFYAAAGGNVNTLGDIDGVNQWPTLVFNKPSPRSEILLNIDETEGSAGMIGERSRYKLLNGSTAYNFSYQGYFGESGRDLRSPPYNYSSVIQSKVNTALKGKLTPFKIQHIRTLASLENCRASPARQTLCTAQTFCLFDLLNDPCENANMAETHPHIVARLQRRLEHYWTKLKPQIKPGPDPRANPTYFNNTWYTWLENDYKY